MIVRYRKSCGYTVASWWYDICMNGGAFGTEIFDRIESVEILDENYNILTLAKENLKFSYRYTEFQEKTV